MLCQALAPVAMRPTRSNSNNAKSRRTAAQQNGNAALETVTPNRATQGQRLTLTLKGRGTKWAAGQTRLSLGAEISVGGATAGEPGPVQVTDSTTAVVEIVISPTASLGARNLELITTSSNNDDPERVPAANAFVVVPAKVPGSAQANVTTIAGAAGVLGYADGVAAQARFRELTGIAAGADDTIYVADTGNHRIRKIGVDGRVTTIAGSATAGFADGAAAQARFASPQAVAVYAGGVVYVADTGNHRIRAISPE